MKEFNYMSQSMPMVTRADYNAPKWRELLAADGGPGGQLLTLIPHRRFMVVLVLEPTKTSDPVYQHTLSNRQNKSNSMEIERNKK